jgi:uncharacterized membrane protein
MVSKLALCVVLTLIAGSLSAPIADSPSLERSLIYFPNVTYFLHSLDYDQLLALIEEYFKGR